MNTTSLLASTLTAALSLSLMGCPQSAVGVSPRAMRIGDGARYVTNVDAVPNRCKALAEPEREAECEMMRREAQSFVQGLQPLQEVCLEGNPLGNGITRRCQVRGTIEDMDLRNIRVKIRESTPDSGFKIMDDYWFHNDAFVDIYLYSLGYKKKGDAESKGK